MLKHADIWRAIDRLAERHGLSASGLAKKAGLSATLFNPSKRANGQRKRWPSTESISQILQATGTALDDFVALASVGAPHRVRMPLIGINDAVRPGLFDDTGRPVGAGWDEIGLPTANDPNAFAVEVTGKTLEPIFRDGDKLILSPAEKPRRGDRVAVFHRDGSAATGEILVRLLGREGDQKIELLPLSSESTPITVSRRSVVWIYRISWASQ